jgi:TonB family protein
MILVIFAAAQLAVTGASVPIPRAPLQNYVTREDYPAGVPPSAARLVEMALTVGTDGRITECRIEASSRTAMLDAATCRLIRSPARFQPARNATGIAIPGTVQATIDWATTLSGAEPPPLVRTAVAPPPRVPQAPWESISRLRVKLGQIGSCQWESKGPVPPPPSSNACQNGELAGMALRMAAENRVDFNRSEVVVTLRMPDGGLIPPLLAAPSALVDLAAELDIGADGTLTSCRFTRNLVRTSASRQPDCNALRGTLHPRDRQDRPGGRSKRQAELRVEAL